MENIVIIGSSGAIGEAFTKCFSQQYPNAMIHCFSQSETKICAENISAYPIEYKSEDAIKNAAQIASRHAPVDTVIVATGLLHTENFMPEKSLASLSAEKLQHLYTANTIVPALMMKYFIPKLRQDSQTSFAALSARVGSISDNHLGGWYAYRASKAALNMIIRNAAIETARRNKQAVIVGLHPGTVDSDLSKPFQKNVPEGKLFSPDYSASKLMDVLASLSPVDSGKCFDWAGKEISP